MKTSPLLARCENEVILGRVFCELTYAGAPLPHRRAASLLDGFRDSAEYAAALRGDVSPLVKRLTQEELKDERDKHHAALLFSHAADCVTFRGDLERAHPLRVRAINLFRSISVSYYTGIADVVVSGTPAVEIKEAARAAGLDELTRVGREARDGALTRSRRGAAAMKILGRFVGDVEGARADEVRVQASAEAAGAVQVALTAVEDGLTEALAKAEPGADVFVWLGEARKVWDWSGQHVDVEKFMVAKAKPICWEIYNAKRWPALRQMTALLRPIVSSLATRIEQTREPIAYAANTAQMLVFESEMDARLEKQIQIAERALRICDTHRNARVVLCDFFVHRANRTLDNASVFGQQGARRRATEDAERARALWPSSKRLSKLDQRLARSRFFG